MGWSIFAVGRLAGQNSPFIEYAKLPLINQAIQALLTPIVYLLAKRYPLRRRLLHKQVPLYAAGALLYAATQVMLRLLAYGAYDVHTRTYYGLFEPAGFRFSLFFNFFFYNAVDNVFGAYLPTVVLAQWITSQSASTEALVRAARLEKQLVEAQLQTLTTELQPHFLFNTLNSISALMRMNVSEADAMMVRLSELLRATLANRGASSTNLQEEIEFLDLYLQIEQTRLRERLIIKRDIASDVLRARVPHLLLQPIVENAIRHGVSRRPTGGTIFLVAGRNEGRLRIWIRDDGPGVSDVSQLSSAGSGLGLKITRERLIALYGANHVFNAEPALPNGVRVTIEMPLSFDECELEK